MLKVVVFTSSKFIYEERKLYLINSGIAADQILFADSKTHSRESIVNEFYGDWLLFIDHDCIPTDSALKWSAQFTEKIPKQDLLVAGRYLDPEKSNLLQRTHNFIANTWIEHSFEAVIANKNFLGGVFLIFSRQKITVPERFWGAEDKAMAFTLNKLGFEIIFSSELTVIHDTSREFTHFIKRAWLHGKNDAKYLVLNSEKINFLYWIRKIDFLNLGLVFLLLLHFCIQRMAKLIQKVLQMSKQ